MNTQAARTKATSSDRGVPRGAAPGDPAGERVSMIGIPPRLLSRPQHNAAGPVAEWVTLARSSRRHRPRAEFRLFGSNAGVEPGLADPAVLVIFRHAAVDEGGHPRHRSVAPGAGQGL